MSSSSTSPPPPPPPPPSPAPSPATNLIPSLPDDVALNCLARLPRSHHPVLSVVSKSIRSILSSPIFYNTRSLIQCTQQFLYLTIRSNSSSFLWFTLYQNPLNSDNPNLLVPVPAIPSHFPSVGSAYAVLGSMIYVIGGCINDVPSSHVWVLDCRFNTWKRGPTMRVGREFAAAGVVDEKIYVMGGCIADNWSRSTNWAEFLDPAIGRWDRVPSPVEVREKWMHASAVVEDKVYAMADRGGVVYDPRNMVWESVGSELDLGWRGRASVVDGILYCYDYLGNIKGFDVKEGAWKELKGLEKGLPRFLYGATMANVGGKLVVVWEGKKNGNGNGKEMEIWCAEIEVKRNGLGELWGKIDWSDKVLSVPNGSSIVHCSAVAL
ncbi:F-box/kelch-repeat protein [Quillaja saponaria]|uniref:F-box/kelch-repeat protein n=1 Tax=Quillaja saponaria TaxID=32244 RepID=A0AAD7PJD0_QUISA|nr:F-box/kelch-repeat protein [Quillaja saponaria]